MLQDVVPERIFFRNAAAVVNAQLLSSHRQNATGHKIIRGNYHASGGAAADEANGFPRLVESEDGTTESRVRQIPRDLGQLDFQYNFKFDLTGLPYLWVEFKVLNAGSLLASVEITPEA